MQWKIIGLGVGFGSPNGPEFELLGRLGKLGKSLANALKTKHNI